MEDSAMRCFVVAFIVAMSLITLPNYGCGLIDIGSTPTPLGPKSLWPEKA